MSESKPDRRALEGGDRRSGSDRRRAKGRRGFVLRLLVGERRQRDERRRGWDGSAAGRNGSDRRSQHQTATDLVRSAFELVAAVRGSPDAVLDDTARQQLDSAMIRLKFALERLPADPPK